MNIKSQNGNHPLNNTLVNLKDFKKALENHVIILDSGRGVSLSNLPTHFWETIGINDIEHHITTKQQKVMSDIEIGIALFFCILSCAYVKINEIKNNRKL